MSLVEEKYRKSANTKLDGTTANFGQNQKNLRTGRLETCPELFHALPSSDETELARELMIQVAPPGFYAQCGHEHDLLLADDGFWRAATVRNGIGDGSISTSVKVVQNAV